MDWRLRRAGEGDAARLSLVAGATFLEAFAGVLDGDDIVAHVRENSGPPAFLRYLAMGAVATLAEAVEGGAPLGATRFDVQVQQTLPFLRFTNAQWAALVALPRRQIQSAGASPRRVSARSTGRVRNSAMPVGKRASHGVAFGNCVCRRYNCTPDVRSK